MTGSAGVIGAIIFHKLLRAVLTVLLIASVTFLVLRITGDPALVMLPTDSAVEAIEQFRAMKGLDRPLLVQYAQYVGRIFVGDFGYSFQNGMPALAVAMEKVAPTLLVTGTGFVLMLIVGVPLGVIGAVRENRLIDRMIIFLTVLGHSIPSYIIGLGFILLFGVVLKALPTNGTDSLWHAVLPIATYAVYGTSLVTRFVRASVIEVLDQPFVRTARSVGFRGWRLMVRHVLPNAAIPAVTMLGFVVGGLIGGSVLIESIFGYSGLGRLLTVSVQMRDIPVVQAILFMTAVTMIASNLIVDILIVALDPRARRNQ